MASLFEEKYRNECVPALKTEFEYKNVMEIPKITKVVINTSIKEGVTDKKVLQDAAIDIATIAGQRPVITKAKKSIASFKLREGNSIGCCVTLRGKRMYEFFSKLVNVALPRVRDFRGVSEKAFDGRGNYTFGLTEQGIFPEINLDKVSRIFGMNITIVTTAKNDEEGRALLRNMGMPFRS